jgi:hypothetical protein
LKFLKISLLQAQIQPSLLCLEPYHLSSQRKQALYKAGALRIWHFTKQALYKAGILQSRHFTKQAFLEFEIGDHRPLYICGKKYKWTHFRDDFPLNFALIELLMRLGGKNEPYGAKPAISHKKEKNLKAI